MHRSTIQSLSPAERTELASMIITYVTPSVVQEHMDWHMGNGPGGMTGPGSGENFLAFHRTYIAKLEAYLTAQGRPQYVPLRTWNPQTPIPPEFSHPGRVSSNPGIPLPTWATVAGGTIPDPLFGHTALGQFASSDELGRALGFQFHGSVHNAIGGDMATFQSPLDPIFFPWHALLDDLWSEWENLPSPPTTPPSRCFIATAAFGSELAIPVQFLREFRDDVVMTSPFRGPMERTLDGYYEWSPPIADRMRASTAFKAVMRYAIVWPLVGFLLAAYPAMASIVRRTVRRVEA